MTTNRKGDVTVFRKERNQPSCTADVTMEGSSACGIPVAGQNQRMAPLRNDVRYRRCPRVAMTPRGGFERRASALVPLSLLVITLLTKAEGKSSSNTEAKFESHGAAQFSPLTVVNQPPAEPLSAAVEHAVNNSNDPSGSHDPLLLNDGVDSDEGSRPSRQEHEEADGWGQFGSRHLADVTQSGKQPQSEDIQSGSQAGVANHLSLAVGNSSSVKKEDVEQGMSDETEFEPSHSDPVGKTHPRRLRAEGAAAEAADAVRQLSVEPSSVSDPPSHPQFGVKQESEFVTGAEKRPPPTAVPVATTRAVQPVGIGVLSTTTLLAKRALEEVGSLGRGIGLYLYGVVFRGNLLLQANVLGKIKENIGVLEFVEEFQPQFAPSRRAIVDELTVWQDTLQRVVQQEQAFVLQYQAYVSALREWSNRKFHNDSGVHPTVSSVVDSQASQAPPDSAPATEQFSSETARDVDEQEVLEPSRNADITESRGPGDLGLMAPGGDMAPSSVPSNAEQVNAYEFQSKPASSLVQVNDTGDYSATRFARQVVNEKPPYTPHLRESSLPSAQVAVTGQPGDDEFVAHEGPETSEVLRAPHSTDAGPDLVENPPEIDRTSSAIDTEMTDVDSVVVASQGSEAVHNNSNADATQEPPFVVPRGVRGPLTTPPSMHASAGIPPFFARKEDNDSADSPAKEVLPVSVAVDQHDEAIRESNGTKAPKEAGSSVLSTSHQNESSKGVALEDNSPGKSPSLPAVPVEGLPGTEAVGERIAAETEEAFSGSKGETVHGHVSTPEWVDSESDTERGLYGRQDSMLLPPPDDVETLDLYLSLLQSTFFKCGALLSRALLADDSKELTWFYQEVLPSMSHLGRVSIAVVASQHRRGVRSAASAERHLQKIRSMLFHVTVVDDAFLHAIYARDEPPTSERLEASDSDEYRKPNARARSQKTKKDKVKVEGTRVGAAIEFAKAHLVKPWVIGLLTFASLVGIDHYGYNRYY
ncbi:hypothetical protein TGDOM2_211460 [Toxoplasma gondii GAB2-2007-GAL-DOM2]|uniref:Uncharacterized protein n=2 Tax=Toxoplasma gondii TaxID=5811 RepID=A0A086K235_TOXGO|nr:hypothetical protein TGDOM2_211460 [Toxoplasma gondii GAB2-2007-GAL-DOM2]KFG38453.1 hypothetical protein TGFOU_211460 [Toxoplasma gondii FOU]